MYTSGKYFIKRRRSTLRVMYNDGLKKRTIVLLKNENNEFPLAELDQYKVILEYKCTKYSLTLMF